MVKSCIISVIMNVKILSIKVSCCWVCILSQKKQGLNNRAIELREADRSVYLSFYIVNYRDIFRILEFISMEKFLDLCHLLIIVEMERKDILNMNLSCLFFFISLEIGKIWREFERSVFFYGSHLFKNVTQTSIKKSTLHFLFFYFLSNSTCQIL